MAVSTPQVPRSAGTAGADIRASRQQKLFLKPELRQRPPFESVRNMHVVEDHSLLSRACKLLISFRFYNCLRTA